MCITRPCRPRTAQQIEIYNYDFQSEGNLGEKGFVRLQVPACLAALLRSCMGFISPCGSSSELSDPASARPALPVHGDPQLGRWSPLPPHPSSAELYSRWRRGSMVLRHYLFSTSHLQPHLQGGPAAHAARLAAAHREK
ncbi:unnamed protein product [Pleuronectes platessa]|uniref:Uncharacterized protein n=1 Tax=Pleuronectes platessa TaxID=8262 RepID=A0A9N7YX91_PLEPL|nr:unnamed protein product [Pleuronectes platessa]